MAYRTERIEEGDIEASRPNVVYEVQNRSSRSKNLLGRYTT